MYEHYRVKWSDKTLRQSRKSLNLIYEAVPETDGCMANIEKEGGCGAWCCEHQNPQVLFVEFLNTWNTVTNQWTKQQQSELFMRAIKGYLDGKTTKGCIFWDTDSKLCTQHKTRPFNCRTYGQIPEEEFKPRYEKLKVLYENDPNAVVREQCQLVKTVGTPPTAKQMEEWWVELLREEMALGFPSQYIHDNDGGTYRTYHDHILLKICAPDFLSKLTRLRTKGTEEEKQAFIAKVTQQLKGNFPDLDVEKLK